MKSGFLIAKNKMRKEFFTASSAYDRPTWLPLGEATVYPTAELADRAAKKLYKNGAYHASIVSLEEMNLSFAPIERPEDEMSPEELGSKTDGDTSVEMGAEQDGEEPEMQAAEQNDDLCPDCEHEPCTCDGEMDSEMDGEMNMDTDSGMEVDSADDIDLGLDGEQQDDFDPNAVPGAGRNLGMASMAPMSSLRRTVGEAFSMPKRPEGDAQPSENKTTAATSNIKVEPLKIKDPAVTGKDESDNAGDHEGKVRVPQEVMSELGTAIAKYEKEAKNFEKSDEHRASFALTAADAMKVLRDELSKGTVAGVKAANIKLSSYMSPITNNIPPSVIKFIYSGGAKPTLKDLFNAKREQR